MFGTSEPGNDRRLNVLLAVSVAVAVAMVVGAFIFGPRILRSASTSDAEAIQRGNELTACRAVFRVEVDDAVAHLTAAKADLDVLTNEGLEASARGDKAKLAGLIGQLEPARMRVERLAKEVDSTTDDYKRLVTLSRDDPDRFIDACHEAT